VDDTTIPDFQEKPPIISVVQNYVELKKRGRQHVGRCPFHDDKTPSFSVSEEKGVFHCFGCGAGGDVIDFVMKLYGLSFREALAELGIDSAQRRRPRRSDALRIKARRLARWADEMTAKAEYLLRSMAPEGREWAILETLAEDLQSQEHVLDLYHHREIIENILANGIIEPWSEFPKLTPEYWEYVTNLPKPKEFP